jgi:CCR4-NOT transcription complex subunit 9
MKQQLNPQSTHWVPKATAPAFAPSFTPGMAAPPGAPMPSAAAGFGGMYAPPPTAPPVPRQPLNLGAANEDAIRHLVALAMNRDERDKALGELQKHREAPDVAIIFWQTPSFVSVLLQEVTGAYFYLTPSATLTTAMSNRVCFSLTCLQCIATHPATRPCFLAAGLHCYLHPFLQTLSPEKPYEFLRLTSLGVIGALAKSDEGDVVQTLLSTDIVPICLAIMRGSTELSRTVATFIMQKILGNESGLQFVCQTAPNFIAVAEALEAELSENVTPRLLRHIIRCYNHLTEHPKARDALRQCLPKILRNGTLKRHLDEDAQLRQSLGRLLSTVGDPAASLYTDSTSAPAPAA